MADRAWYKYASPEQKRGLEAASWRRRAEAAVFSFRNDPVNDDEDFGDFIDTYLERSRTNPLALTQESPRILPALPEKPKLRRQEQEVLPLTDIQATTSSATGAATSRADARRQMALFVLGTEDTGTEVSQVGTEDLVDRAITSQRGFGLGPDTTTLEEAFTKRLGAIRDDKGGLSPLRDLGRLGGSVIGAASGVPEAIEELDPGKVLQGGIEGFQEPEKHRTINAPIIRDTPENIRLGGATRGLLPDIPLNLKAGPVNLTPKTGLALGLEAITDPLNAVPIPLADEVGRAAVRGIRRGAPAASAATRAASGLRAGVRRFDDAARQSPTTTVAPVKVAPGAGLRPTPRTTIPDVVEHIKKADPDPQGAQIRIAERRAEMQAARGEALIRSGAEAETSLRPFEHIGSRARSRRGTGPSIDPEDVIRSENELTDAAFTPGRIIRMDDTLSARDKVVLGRGPDPLGDSDVMVLRHDFDAGPRGAIQDARENEFARIVRLKPDGSIDLARGIEVLPPDNLQRGAIGNTGIRLRTLGESEVDRLGDVVSFQQTEALSRKSVSELIDEQTRAVTSLRRELDQADEVTGGLKGQTRRMDIESRGFDLDIEGDRLEALSPLTREQDDTLRALDLERKSLMEQEQALERAGPAIPGGQLGDDEIQFLRAGLQGAERELDRLKKLERLHSTGMGAAFADPAEGLRAVIKRRSDLVTEKGKPERTLLREHEAAITQAERRAGILVDDGNKVLEAAGIGQRTRGQLVARQQDIAQLDQLFEGLHTRNRDAVPPKLQRAYDELVDLTEWEEGARFDFNPEMARVEDYFYRGWKAPDDFVTGAPGGQGFGTKPAFTKGRADFSYRELRNAGFEPLSWNPYEQWRISRMQGIRYREQMELIDNFKQLEQAVPHNGGRNPTGWRTPEIGHAFEGKPFGMLDDAGEPVVGFTRRWIVPDDLAKRLENMYGKKPTMIGVKTDKVIDWLTFVPKRAKLFGSLFQQQDFLTRSGIGAWSGMVDGLRARQPVAAVKSMAQLPPSALKILRANLSPDARAGLKRQWDSTAPLVEGRPGVNLKGIVDGGLSTIDVTILPQDIDNLARSVVDESGVVGSAKRVSRFLGDIDSAMRRGLFEGVYPAAQMTDIQNNIAPMVLRRFPNATDQQANAMIARITNIKYSTIPASQSVIQNQHLRQFMTRAFFSVGESEGLLRQATGAAKLGPEGSFWRTHWISAYLFLMTSANIIHFASTGEPLPPDRYAPLSRNEWGPLPFGYNRDFAAPNIPLTGRNGTELTLDIVAQMDTAFRILDPQSFVTSRFSAPARAALNQLKGESFTGDPLDTVGPEGIVSRTVALIDDLFTPIGAGSTIQQGSRRFLPDELKDLVPEGESRIGPAGTGIQSAGFNVRSETTPDLLERAEREGVGTDEGPIADELLERRDTSVRRGSPGAIKSQLSDEVRAEFRAEQEAEDAKFVAGTIGGADWRAATSDRNSRQLAALGGVFKEAGRDLNTPIQNPETPFDFYINQIIESKDATGQPDWDQVNAWVAAQAPQDRASIDAERGWDGTEQELKAGEVRNQLDETGFFEIRDSIWQGFLETPAPRSSRLPPLPKPGEQPREPITVEALKGFESWDDFEQTMLTEIRARFSDGASREQKIKDFRSSSSAVRTRWNNALNEAEAGWISANEALASDAILYQYLRPTAPQLGILTGEEPTGSRRLPSLPPLP